MAFTSIGVSKKRADAVEKVTGQAVYVADIKLPRMLHAKVLRAGVAHARILSIDTSEAESMPGVRAVVTGKDCNIIFGICIKDQTPLAVDKVRHAGEGVAVAIADTEAQAAAACKTIKVEYEPLPHVVDPLEAVKEGAPQVHERNGDYEHVPGFHAEKGSNVFHHYKLRKGRAADGFDEAEIIVQGRFEFPHMAHMTIEPHGAIARWESDGGVTVWASSQGPYVLRSVLSHMYDLPMTKIRVVVPFLGGGFGCKSDVVIEPLVAAVAKAVPGRPVRLILDRKEAFTSSVVGRGMKGRMKIGAKKDGTLEAIEAGLYFADGAFADTSCNVVTAGGHNCTGPYEFRHCHLDSYGVYTNTPPVGAFRGYSHPEGHLMCERLMDLLARELGMSPFELRRKNFLHAGSINALGQTITAANGDLNGCLTSMEKAVFSGDKPVEDDRYVYGRGVASLMKSPVTASNAASCAVVRFNNDATVTVSMAGIEMGQGCTTVLAQIAAEELKVPYERVRVIPRVDTDLSPYEWMTVASMTTYRVGNAIVHACRRCIIRLLDNAALVLEVPEDELEYDGEFVFVASDPSRRVALKDLVKGYTHPDGHCVGDPVVAVGSHIVRGLQTPDPESGQGNCAAEWTFGAQACEVRVEKATGKVEVTHFATALDVGKVINPQTARGQVVGGVLQGLGHALKEEVLYKEDGNLANPVIGKYNVPAVSDMPGKQTVDLLETPQEDGPFGARAMAEHPIVAVCPAVLNAVQDATGVDLFRVPVLPDELKRAMDEKGGGA